MVMWSEGLTGLDGNAKTGKRAELTGAGWGEQDTSTLNGVDTCRQETLDYSWERHLIPFSLFL